MSGLRTFTRAPSWHRNRNSAAPHRPVIQLSVTACLRQISLQRKSSGSFLCLDPKRNEKHSTERCRHCRVRSF